MNNYALPAFLLAFLVPGVAFAGLVNINTANTTELETLPGIGPAKAAAIVDYRTAHGPFTQSIDIQKVKGIGPATYENLKDLITIGDVSSVATNAKVQPQAAVAGSYITQAVGSARNQPVHDEEAIIAPGTTTMVGVPGAIASPAEAPAVSRPFESKWALALFGLVAFVGAAFLIL
jgi:competence ComEA-like helix-hairpin-helix protein